MINELFGILCVTNSCTFFLHFFLLSTFRILFRGIRDGSLSLFLLQFMVSFKSSPLSKLIELSRLYSEHAVQILTSIAVQFLDPVFKDSEGFCVPLPTLKIVTFWYTASFTLLVTRTAELVIQFNWLNGQRFVDLFWLICFDWLICFATATGRLEQWPSNTTWLIWFATTTGQFDQTSRTVQNKTRSGWCTGSRSGTHFPQALINYTYEIF